MIGVLLLAAACARAPLAGVPSPSSEASPSIDVSPVANESPAGAASPSSVATPPSTPRSTPTTTRPTATPTLPPLAITPGTMPLGEVGIAYPTVSFAATGGKPPYTWSINAGAPPPGITLASNSVSGTPTAAGTAPFTIAATDAAGHVATSARSIVVQPALAVTGFCELSPCSVEAGCTAVCGDLGSQSGGVGPFTYSPQGTLPPGMALSTLSLTGPFPAGSYKFGVQVSDALGATASFAAAFNVFAHIALASGSCSQKAGSG